MNHREALKEAFKNIRRFGICARMNFACCSSCGHYELSEKGHKEFVFWNRQSDDAFDNDEYGRGYNLTHSLWLQWEGYTITARRIVFELQQAGLDVAWEGDIGSCIEVKTTPVRYN